MSVRMRHTKGHTRNRRSHHRISSPRLTTCSECGEKHLMHRVCPTCGKYRGKVVIDMEKKIAKREEKTKRREKELEQAGIKKTSRTEEVDTKDKKDLTDSNVGKKKPKVLDISNLSKKQ